MESNNITSRNVLAGYGGVGLQGPMSVNHDQHHLSLQQPHNCPVLPVLPLTIGHDYDYECDKSNSLPRNCRSDEEENGFCEEGCKGNTAPWQRVKWVDKMIRLLITAVSYLGEDSLLESGGRGKVLSLHKKGKWKLVSKVMAERGCYVSPQQCEDKFNDLNKRYKKLNEILGRGTSCQVVENPSLLDMMDHLSEKSKDEVRKILSSKHLFYEEMCSYHNNNRSHLPHDPGLQQSLQLALKQGDHGVNSMRHPCDDGDEDDCDHDVETGDQSDHDEFDENYGQRAYKRMKLGLGLDEFNFGNPHSIQDISKGLEFQSENPQSRLLQLEKLRLKIEMETLELEKERFRWQRLSKKKDRELEKLKMENDRMKLENECTALELKRMEMTINCNK